MKPYSIIILLIALALFLSACGGNDVNVVTTEDASIDSVYTAVALTLTAQANEPTSTVQVQPSFTPTVVQSPTSVQNIPTLWSTSTSGVYSTAYGCYNAIYVSDVTISDGTVLAPSQSFTKTWQFQNTGSCDWDADFLLTFEMGDEMDGETVTVGSSVDIGDVESISVDLVAPDTEGTYTGYWRLSTEGGYYFGESVYVLILVSDDAATLTPTTTATATMTTTANATATSTPTVEVTAISTPTLEETATSTPTVEASATNTPTVEVTATYTPTHEETATSTPTIEATATFTPIPTETSNPESDTDSTSVTMTILEKLQYLIYSKHNNFVHTTQGSNHPWYF